MHTLKVDVDQKHLYDLNQDVLRDLHKTYNVPQTPAPKKLTIPTWVDNAKQFENPRMPFMNLNVEMFSMAFATQLRKLSKLSPKVPTITLTIDNLQKFELRQYHTPEEIYDALNF